MHTFTVTINKSRDSVSSVAAVYDRR